ncbi:MAG: glycosyl transferase family protein [Pseudomonadota bacterium]
MSISAYVRAMGRGPGRARSLERAEAADAMRQILDGTADPHAVGALFMLMRYRGESAEEIAGFVEAMRARLQPWQEVGVALDWPSYAAGRSRGLPWFLLSARVVAAAGVPVLLHGWNGEGQGIACVRSALAGAGIGVAETPAAARRLLAHEGIAYAPLEALDGRLIELLRLREVLGLRSPVNSCLRGLNPAGARAAVQGVFHPTFRALQRDAAALLGQPDLAVIKGGGGEFERHPGKRISVFGLRGGTPVEAEAPARLGLTARLAEITAEGSDLASVLAGGVADPQVEEIIIGTAGLALRTAGVAADLDAAEALAAMIWAELRGKGGGAGQARRVA